MRAPKVDNSKKAAQPERVPETLTAIVKELGIRQDDLKAIFGVVGQASVSKKLSNPDPKLSTVIALERAAGVAPGFIFRALGVVTDPTTPDEAVALDTRLTPGWRRSVSKFYVGALEESEDEKRASEKTKAAPAKRRRR